MTCEIVTHTQDIIQAVRDLQERAESIPQNPSLPAGLTTMCGDGGGVSLIADIYVRVQQFVVDAGESVIENFPRPARPEVIQCINGPWLHAVEDWIDGIEVGASFTNSIVMIWIDEADDAYYPDQLSNWTTDLAAFRARRRIVGTRASST